MPNKISILGFVTAAAVALACAAPPLPEQEPLAVGPLQIGEGEIVRPDDVLVLTDASGTMYARKTFPEAKALTRTLINSAPDASSRPGGYDMGLISFGGDDRITAPVAAFNRAALADTAASLRILGDLDGFGGETPYRHVLPESGAALRAASAGPSETAIVVFSDGLADLPEYALVAGQALTEGHEGRLCIHTVQTGDDPIGTQFLQSLSGLTGCGSHRMASSVRDPGAFNQLARDVFVGKGPLDACKDVIRLQGVTFDFDKSDIRAADAVVLDVAAEQLVGCPEVNLRVEGHTDWIGSDTYNQGLSERRAGAVKSYLAGKGVSSGRLTTRGFGESQPIAPNANPDGSDNAQGRAQNRRVELHPQN